MLFFLGGGVLALVMRTQLAQPDLHVVSSETYNEFFTMHGSIMIYLFIVPFAVGLANFLVPLQIGAPDVAFPRLNALAYWLYLFGGLAMVSGFLTASGAAHFGWFAYAPLSRATLAARGRARPGVRRVDHRRHRHEHGRCDGRRQPRDHDLHAARARDDHVPDADLHVEHAGRGDDDSPRLPRAHGSVSSVVRGPPSPRTHLRSLEGWHACSVAAHVLVLRPPRGLHRGAAVLRR